MMGVVVVLGWAWRLRVLSRCGGRIEAWEADCKWGLGATESEEDNGRLALHAQPAARLWKCVQEGKAGVSGWCTV